MEILMDDKEKSEEEFKKRYQHPAFKGKKPCKRCTLYPAYQSSEYCSNCEIEVESEKNRGYEITKTNSSAIENIEKIDDGMERMKAYQFLYQQIWIKLEKLIEENKGNG
jgi:hypothetical protein